MKKMKFRAFATRAKKWWKEGPPTASEVREAFLHRTTYRIDVIWTPLLNRTPPLRNQANSHFMSFYVIIWVQKPWTKNRTPGLYSSRYGRSWWTLPNRMHCLADGFNVIQSRISYRIFLEPLMHAIYPVKILLMDFAILFKICLAYCDKILQKWVHDKTK